jgi:hypothetical protein
MVNIVVNRQAPESGGATADDDEKRKKVSKRAYLTVNGGECDKIEEATGARYTLLGTAGGEKHFDQQFGDAGKFATMCSIFGFHTKVGNVANTVLNDKSEPGTPDDAADAIAEFISKASDAEPVWAERTGGVGAKIDLDALAGAIVQCAESKGKELDVLEIREKLEGDKALVRKMRQVPEIATAYNARVGKVVNLDDALAGL